MLPFKKILCPLDFSEPSMHALKVANEMAIHFSSQLIIVHVVPQVPIPYVPPATYAPGFVPPASLEVKSYQKELEDAHGRTLNEIATGYITGNIDLQKILLSGDPVEEIIQTAERERVDLLVIATHGMSGWKRFIFGSVTEKIVRLSHCPVLTIHPPGE